MELLLFIWLVLLLCIIPFLTGLMLYLFSPSHRRTARYLMAFAMAIFVALVVFPWLKVAWQLAG